MSTTIASEPERIHRSPSRTAVPEALRHQLAKIARAGLEPHPAALAISLGLAFGLLPIPWGTSLLCGLVAWRLQLNQPLVQLLNYLCYPLQIALYLPLCRLGTAWFAPPGFGPAWPSEGVLSMALTWDLLTSLWQANLLGIACWACLVIAGLPVCYLVCQLVIRWSPLPSRLPKQVRRQWLAGLGQ